MTRKIALLIAALIIPGGLVALAIAWLVHTLGQNRRARKLFKRVGGMMSGGALIRAPRRREAA